MAKFEVPIIYRGLNNYIVEADTPEAAKTIAEGLFMEGAYPEVLGNEWETILQIRKPELIPEEAARKAQEEARA